MKSPSIDESAAQKRSRQRSEQERIKTIQEGANERTSFFQRLTNPRMSLMSGFRSQPVARSTISNRTRPRRSSHFPEPR